MLTKNEKQRALFEISEVKELHLITDVNAHIKLGWKIIDTYKTTAINKNQSIKYCMGRPKTVAKMVNHSNRVSKDELAQRKKFVYSL